MFFIDSHCHLNMLDLSQFEDNLDHVIQAAHENLVTELLCVSVELSDFTELSAIADKYAHVYFSTGLHPHSAHQVEYDAALLQAQVSAHPKCIALGETGLDYYRLPDENEKSVIALQIESLQKHMAVALTTRKPLIIHTRDAGDDTIFQLKQGKMDEVGGVIHCFTESWDFAKKALDLNFYISFSGIVTFKNAKDLQEIARKIPADRLLIETDAPYLAPTPHRGKQNQPAFVKHVAEYLAELRGESIEDLAQKTTQNFYDCFKLTEC